MFCPNCGSTIADDASFCGICGARIERAAAAPRRDERPRQGSPVPPRRTPAAGADALLDHAPLIASVLALVALALPMCGTGFLGFSESMSGLDMIFGGEAFGHSYDGDLSNLLLLVPGVLGLVGTLLAHGRAALVTRAVGGALGVLLVLILGSAASESGDYDLQVGFWLLLLASVALVALSVRGLVAGARAR